MNSPDVLSDGPQTLDELKERMLERTGELSVLPSAATAAIQMAEDPNCAMSDFVDVVQRDVSLTASVLKMSNSPIFGGGTQTLNLTQAVVRLGSKQCRNLIISSCAESLMKSLPLEAEWARNSIWQHSFITATAATLLSRTLEVDTRGEEFTAGLMHDFGRLLLAILAPESFCDFDPLDYQEDDENALLLREQEAIGTDHCEFGAWFVDHIGMPAALAQIVRCHHSPEDHCYVSGGVCQTSLVGIVRAADYIANHLQNGNHAILSEPHLNPGIQELGELLGEDLQLRYEEHLPTVIAEIKSACELA